MTAFTAIGEVDLGAWWGGDEAERRALAARMLRECHEVGFFLLVGHRVPSSLAARFDGALRAFFALDERTKERIEKRRSPLMRGWERIGSERTGGLVDHREQLDLSTEHPARAATVTPAYLRLDGDNPWLPESVLPGFRATLTEYLAAMRSLADVLLDVLSLAFELELPHLRTVFGERPLSLFKCIRYPATPAGSAGVNPHHDAGFLTLLRQHDVAGLQAQNPDGAWVDVPVRPDAFVVNLGEMLQEMTGNHVVAATHRVIATEARFSSAYFHGPDLRTVLAPLPLGPRFVEAVARSPRHRNAGFMATAEQIASGEGSLAGRGAGIYGQQLWNYYRRSYPDLVATHHPGW